MMEALLTTVQAAEHLGLSPRTLEDWRVRGGGPPYRKLGRKAVRYAPADLMRFQDDATLINTGGGRPD